MSYIAPTMYSKPLAYFITFRTFGTWLPGDNRGYTRHSPDEDGSKRRLPNKPLAIQTGRRSRNTVTLTPSARIIVESAISRVCDHRGWSLLAINVRSNHVHVVIAADVSPERVMNAIKSWATRSLRERDSIAWSAKVWARHGSTIYLFTEREVEYALWYTTEAQDGERFDSAR